MTDTNTPACPPAEVQHAMAAFRRHAVTALLAGDTPSLADLAERTSRTSLSVAKAITWLEGHGALERDGDRLIGVHGLTHRPTPHTVTIGGRTVHTWCALDALAIPIALAATSTTRTTCPICGRTLTVEIRNGGLPDDPDFALWLPDVECRNVIDDFCPQANLFCSVEHLAAWRAESSDPSGRPLALSDIPDIALVEWADIAAEQTGPRSRSHHVRNQPRRHHE